MHISKSLDDCVRASDKYYKYRKDIILHNHPSNTLISLCAVIDR